MLIDLMFNVFTKRPIPQHQVQKYVLSMLDVLRSTTDRCDQKVLDALKSVGDIVCSFERHASGLSEPSPDSTRNTEVPHDTEASK
jgi:hypothetical protein